jgi:hypothetical protein
MHFKFQGKTLLSLWNIKFILIISLQKNYSSFLTEIYQFFLQYVEGEMSSDAAAPTPVCVATMPQDRDPHISVYDPEWLPTTSHPPKPFSSSTPIFAELATKSSKKYFHYAHHDSLYPSVRLLARSNSIFIKFHTGWSYYNLSWYSIFEASLTTIMDTPYFMHLDVKSLNIYRNRRTWISERAVTVSQCTVCMHCRTRYFLTCYYVCMTLPSPFSDLPCRVCFLRRISACFYSVPTTWLTTLPPWCAGCLKIWEPPASWNPKDLSRPVMGLLYLYLLPLPTWTLTF